MARQFSGFFDSSEGDERSYVAEEFAQFFRAFFDDGVKELGENLRVVPGSGGLTSLIRPGVAVLQGYYYGLFDDGGAAMELIHDEANAQPRIDRVILRLDRSTGARNIVPMILKGVAALSPEPPKLTRDGILWDVSLARVRIDPGAETLSAENIADERENADVCGVIEPYAVKKYLDQGLKTTDSPRFEELTINNKINTCSIYVEQDILFGKSSTPLNPQVGSLFRGTSGSVWYEVLRFKAALSAGAVLEVNLISEAGNINARGNAKLIVSGGDPASPYYSYCRIAYADSGIVVDNFRFQYDAVSGYFILYFYAPQYTGYRIFAKPLTPYVLDLIVADNPAETSVTGAAVGVQDAFNTTTRMFSSLTVNSNLTVQGSLISIGPTVGLAVDRYLANTTHPDTLHTTGIYGIYGRSELPGGGAEIGIGVLDVFAYSYDWVQQLWYPIEANGKGYKRQFLSGISWTLWAAN